MAACFWTVLLALVVLTAILCARAKTRLANFEMGQVFRDWIVKSAPPVLAESEAPEMARIAAALMLECVYSPGKLAEVAKKGGVRSELPPGFLGRLGHYRQFVEDGVDHLAALWLLQDRRMGSAFRILMEEGDGNPSSLFARVAYLAKAPVDAAQSRSDRAEAAMDAISRLPSTRIVKSGFLHLSAALVA